MKQILKTAGVIATLMLFTSCVTDGVGKYRIQSIGKASRSVSAVVLSANPVTIIEGTTGAGANAGAALGGAYALDTSDSAAVLVAGVIAGAVIGEAIEANGNEHNATEYLIQTDNEILLTVAQIDANQEIFSKGDKVILVYGHPHRLIRDPR